MAETDKPKDTLKEFYELIGKYEEYNAGKISIFAFLGLESSGSETEIKNRCRQIRRIIHPDRWRECPNELELVSKYSGEINGLLDSLNHKDGLGSHFEEESYSKYEHILFDGDKGYKMEKLRRLLEKDSNFSYNGLDSLIEHYITSTISYISSMNIRQRKELISAYFSVLEFIRLEYKSFYNSFVSSNFIVVDRIGLKEKPTFNESLEEYAIKLKNIKSKYSLSAILTKKLEIKLSNKKKYSNDIGHIESVLKGYIIEIANRGLSDAELSIGISAVIENRCSEFDKICSSSLEAYREIKRTVPTLKNRYLTLKSLCKDRSILSKIEILLKELESSLKTINSFDVVFNKIGEVTLMLKAIKFKGRVAPKIDRYYNAVKRGESRKCKNDDKKDYWALVSSNLEKIYHSWMSNLNLSADLLVELFKEIDINNREKTDRILRFLNYSTSGIFIRRKESCPSKDDFDSFYILEHAGINSSNFLIYQINSNDEVNSCPIGIDELFEFYLPLDEVVFLHLKYYFRTSDFDGTVLFDDISNGYFLLSCKEGYGINVGENRYSYNVMDILPIDGVKKADIFTSICDFVKKRLSVYKKPSGYLRK